MTRYTFSFHGQLLAEENPLKVKILMAKQFGVTTSELNGLFDGSQIFAREGLNKIVATEYFKLFRRLGAVGKITKQSKAESNTPHCPACRSLNIDTEKCLDCGVYFHKLGNPQPSQQKKTINDSEAFNHTANKEAHAAAKLLNRAGLVLIAIFIIDNFLSGTLLPGFSNIDIGYLPYLIAHIFLVYACSRFAAIKGYSRLMGGLGLLSFLGVAILLMLPDKRNDNEKPSFQTVALTVVCVLIMAVWFQDFSGRQNNLTIYNEKAATLSQGRNQFPDKIDIIESATLLAQREALEDFQTMLLTSISDYNYRPDEQVELLETMLSETARFRTWLSYQRHLVYTENWPPLPELSTEYLNKLDNDIAKRLDKLIPDNAEPRLIQTKNEWTFGINPEHKHSHWTSNFNRELFDFTMELRFQINIANDNKSVGKRAVPDISSLKIPKITDVTITPKKDNILLTMNKGPIAGESMVIGIYSYPYRKDPFTKRDIYYTMIKPIYITFPAKYLHGDMNPFKPYTP